MTKSVGTMRRWLRRPVASGCRYHNVNRLQCVLLSRRHANTSGCCARGVRVDAGTGVCRAFADRILASARRRIGEPSVVAAANCLAGPTLSPPSRAPRVPWSCGRRPPFGLRRRGACGCPLTRQFPVHHRLPAAAVRRRTWWVRGVVAATASGLRHAPGGAPRHVRRQRRRLVSVSADCGPVPRRSRRCALVRRRPP